MKFLGEDGQDGGGLTRELCQLILQGIQLSSLFVGEAGNMFPANNMQHLVNGAYFRAGQLVASIICQGGPSVNIFSAYLIEGIINGKDPSASEIPLPALDLVVRIIENKKKIVIAGRESM